jgi:hypothetical protein
MSADFASRNDLARSLLEGEGDFDPRQVSCLTLLAGAGTRWVKSLAAARERLAEEGETAFGPIADFPLDSPRGLFPVRNFLGLGGPTIPLSAYALDAFRSLGRHLIVIRGWEREIRQKVLAPLGIPDSKVDFHSQAAGPSGKVLGHGDATLQAFDLWKDSKYIIVNFGGDASSPLTALIALLTMKSLGKEGEGVDLLLPVARIEGGAYPIFVDGEGLPRRFGHDKLGGGEPGARDSDLQGSAAPIPESGSVRLSGFTNVGVRVYRSAALAEALGEMKQHYWREGIGWDIPGNDPAGHEFALDNVDALLASRGRARILPMAAPEELTPAKSFDELGAFEAAIEKVRRDWDNFRSAGIPRNPSCRFFD